MKRDRQLRLAVIACVLVLAPSSPVSGRVIYVDDDAPTGGDGSSWTRAYQYLQDALAVARTTVRPVEIRVAQGIYRPDRGASRTAGDRAAAFRLVDGALLRGGYAGVPGPDPNTRDVHRYGTTLSGDLLGNDGPVISPANFWREPTRSDNSEHVVTGEHVTEATVLDGFTITGGCYSAIPRNGSSLGGPGVRLKAASPTLTNCWLCNNHIRAGGGGGLFNYGGGQPTIIQCVFSGNSAAVGGAISNEDGSPARVINCTFYSNRAVRGGAIYNHCTVSNCILWGNQSDEINQEKSGPIITYSDIAGGWRGEGNIRVDPCFVKTGYWADPNNVDVPVSSSHPDTIWIEGNYHLKSQAGHWDAVSGDWHVDDMTSPCVDAGNPASPIGYEPFPNGGRINMGAYGGTPEASRSYFGRPVCQTITPGDINGDCRVDFSDLAIMASHWSWDPDALPAVPSPDSIRR